MSAKNWLRLLLLLVVGGLFVAGWYFDVEDRIDVDLVRDTLEGFGPLGGLVFVLAVSILQPLHISIHVFLLAASVVWDPAEAILYGWLATLGSGLTSFAFGRFMARDWVQANLPEKFRKYEAKLERNTFKTVLVLRLIFFTTPMLQFFYGAVKLRFWPWFAATAIGNLPTVVVVVLLGWKITAWLETL